MLHADNSSVVSVFPDGCKLLTSSLDGNILLWDWDRVSERPEWQGGGFMATQPQLTHLSPTLAQLESMHAAATARGLRAGLVGRL